MLRPPRGWWGRGWAHASLQWVRAWRWLGAGGLTGRGAVGLAWALPARQHPCGSGGGLWVRRGGCLRQVAVRLVLSVRLD